MTVATLSSSPTKPATKAKADPATPRTPFHVLEDPGPQHGDVRIMFAHALHVSPLNVRKNLEDAEAVDALAASIVANGLMQRLTVHRSLEKDAPTPFAVLAGGRRLRAIQQAIAADHLPESFPIETVLIEGEPAAIIELSLTENLLRRDLRPYEIHKAVADAAAGGKTVDQIAHDIGQRPYWVRRQLRLGNLAPTVFAAYASGHLDGDQAQAYAATEDQVLQRQVFEQLAKAPGYQRGASEIRRLLKVGDYELARLLLFVGEAIYRSAGGRFEQDLFAAEHEHRGRVVDEALLRELADQKSDTIRETIRLQTQERDLRFVATPPGHKGAANYELVVEPKKGSGSTLQLPSAEVVAHIEIAQDGTHSVDFYWPTRKAKADAGVARRKVTGPGSTRELEDEAISQGGDYAQRARAGVKDEHGLTADGLEIVRSQRRQILRALLVKDADKGGTLARDYGDWARARTELKRKFSAQTGARGLRPDDGEPDVVRDFASGNEVEADRWWSTALAVVQVSDWMIEEDDAASLAAYLDLSTDAKNAVAAVVTGLSLLRSVDAPGYRAATHDVLAARAGGTDAEIRTIWNPLRAFVGLFPKLKRLELATPFVEATLPAKWANADDRALTEAVTVALNGETTGEDGATAEHWVHPLLGFNVPAPKADDAGVGS